MDSQKMRANGDNKCDESVRLLRSFVNAVIVKLLVSINYSLISSQGSINWKLDGAIQRNTFSVLEIGQQKDYTHSQNQKNLNITRVQNSPKSPSRTEKKTERRKIGASSCVCSKIPISLGVQEK